jgi:hypothetical protein
LREKAAVKNPDEFSYKMLSSRTDEAGRLLADRGNKSLSQDVVRLLKTQDAGYLRTKLQIERKRQEKLGQMWSLNKSGDSTALSSTLAGKHTLYTEDEALEEYEDSSATLAESPEPPKIPPAKFADEEIRQKTLSDRARLLHMSRIREKQLRIAEQELLVQRAMMGKSATVSGKTRTGLTWKPRERKR